MPDAPSGTETLARSIASALGGTEGVPACDVLILRSHGALSVGGSVEEALARLEIAEHLAMTLLLAERRG